MIYGIDDFGATPALQEFTTPRSRLFGLGVDEAMSDNIVTKLWQDFDVRTAKGRMVFADETQARVKEAGVEVKNLPEDGIREEALTLLIERAYEKKVRAEALAAAEGGAGKWGLYFPGALAGSLMDPIAVASAFIPFVGQARYAGMLARAASPLARAGVRAGVGAVEGAAGNALLEPLSYVLSQRLGDDYTLRDSMLNIAMGGAMGATLHVGGGLVKDAVLPRFETVPRMTPEQAVEATRVALAQLAEGRRVNVEPMLDLYRAVEAEGFAKRPIAQGVETGVAAQQGAPMRFGEPAQGVPSRLGEETLIAGRSEASAAAVARGEPPIPEGMVRMYQERTADGAKAGNAEGRGFSAEPTTMREGVRLEYVDVPKEVADAVAQAGTGKTGRGLPKEWTDKARPLPVQAPRAAPTPERAAASLRTAAAHNLQPISRLTPEDISVRQQVDADLRNVPPEMKADVARQWAADDLATLKDEAKLRGIELPERELADLDEGMKNATRREKAVEAIALCSLRK